MVEDDAMSVEDDDMIGIFSQTIPLEEIFNTHADFKWAFLGGNDYQLKITEYPIYNSSNQLSLENPLSPDFERQKAHNRNRRPSALVSLTINLTMGDMSIPHPMVDTSLDLGLMASGRDTLSMKMKSMASTPADGRILDVYQGAAIVGDSLTTAVLFKYGVAPYYLSQQFTYDVNTFTGDLAPIKASLSSPKTLSTKTLPLPIVRLLPGNRMLFGISHHDGARLMIVKYTDDGAMTLETSVLVQDEDEDEEDNPVTSLLKAKLSPNRTRLLVPFVPMDYAAGPDKKIPAYTHLNIYELDLAENEGETTEITRLSSSSFGAGAPLTSIEFIDETHVAALTRTLVFGEEGVAWWPNWETVQESCTNENLDCLFELVGNDILLFTINDSHRLELTDTLDIFYSPPYEVHIKSYYPLKTIFSFRDRVNDLQCVSTIEGASSVVRLGLNLFQLQYDRFTDAYYFKDRSSYQNVPSLRYNPDGAYYCADGITCSGYLKSAVSPHRGDENVYQSSEKVGRFEFADTDRDLALGFEGTTLHLLSLYDGAAYKGPQITGDMLGTTIKVGTLETLDISFTVTDRDTPLSELEITMEIVPIATPAGYAGTIIAPITSTPNAIGGYDCTGTLSTGAFDSESTLSQRVIIRVSDGTYTSEKECIISHKPSILIPFADATHGVELWRTDGSTATLFHDTNPTGDSVSFSTRLFKSGKRYFYTPNDGNGDQRLFTTTVDSVPAPLKEGVTDAAYPSFTAMGNHLFFRTAPTGTESTLWKTDGTSTGTTPVKTISSGNIYNLFTMDDTLYFYVNGDGSSSPDALWKSDGTEDGTEPIKGSLKMENDGPTPSHDRIFFSAQAMDNSQCGLWVSDGTTAGTQLLKEYKNPPVKLTDMDGTLYFHVSYDTRDAENNNIHHMDLWRSDGTVDSTVLVKPAESQYFLSINQMVVVNHALYFEQRGVLWSSDGSEGGTVELKKLWMLDGFNQIVWDGLHVADHTLYIHIQHIAPSLGYQIYAITPSISDELIEVGERSPNKITLYKETVDESPLLYATEDADHYYLWRYTADDGSTLIETTDK